MPRFAPATAYLLLAVAWTWPLSVHAASRFAHDPGDPLLNTFILWWDARVFPLSRAMWNAPFYWPMRDALALTEHEAGLGLIGGPIQWLGGTPLLAYNLILIASVWWSGLSMHALVRRLTGHAGAAWCAGVIWSLAPYRAGQLAHLQVLATWWMPIALLALHAYYENGRRRWLLVFGGAWLLQALSNGYYMFFFPVLVGGWIAAMTPWRSAWRRAAAVAATWAVFALPLVPVLLEYYSVQRALGLVRTREEMQMFGARWTSLVHCPPLLRFWPNGAARSQEDFLFPGVAALAIVAAALALRPRQLLTRSFLFYAIAAVMCTWLASGPSPHQWSAASLWHPYDWIAWLPGFDGLRVPARFFMLSTLCLSVAAGFSVAALATGRQSLAVVLGVCALACLDGWIRPMPLGVPPSPFGMPLDAGARVLELPVDNPIVSAQAMYRATLHGRPVVNGYAGYVPPHMRVIEWALRRGDPSIVTELRRGRPLYVLVANDDSAPQWTTFMEGQHEASLISISGAGRLYFLPAAPFPPQVALGPAVTGWRGERTDRWLILDLNSFRTVRAVEVRTDGHLTLLPPTLRIETSADGAVWTTLVDELPGGPALTGAVRAPLAVPLRFLLPDPSARFLRINLPTVFNADSITIYGP